MFPMSMEGTIVLDGPTTQRSAEVLDNLRAALAREKATDIELRPDGLRFRTPLFTGRSWRVLVPFDEGDVTLTLSPGRTLTYNFSTRRMLAITVGMAMFFLISLRSNGAPAGEQVMMPALAWLWLFGMNYLLALFRVPIFLRNAVLGS